MSKKILESWLSVVPNLESITRKMQEKTIIAVGALPYLRITPAIFLRNYQIYCVKDVADLDVLRRYARITSLEEHAPKVAARVQATSYLLGNYVFQGFLKSRRRPFRLLLNQTTPPIVKKLGELNADWIGNYPESFTTVNLKGSFRQVLKDLQLPHLADDTLSRHEFSELTIDKLLSEHNGSAVIQRADVEVGGVAGTYFIHTPDDFAAAKKELGQDDRWQSLQVSRFVKGHATSMLGCVTPLGVLTSPLQLQLIDVPETRPGLPPTGSFNGHDWDFVDWPHKTEQEAQKIVETIGSYLADQGYKGIFGIDFMYDTNSQTIYPIECNPRPTGALPAYSLMTIQQGRIPPLDFFHLMAHLEIDGFYDFDAVNQELKRRSPLAHISLNPTGILEMKLSMKAGIYTYEESNRALRYRRPGAFPWQLKEDSEFIIIDSVARPGKPILQSVPRFFKLIFRKSIAASSNSIQPDSGQLIASLAAALRRGQ